MFQLIYTSVAQTGLNWSDVDCIVAAARHNNRRHEITGLLVHDGLRFMQVLEGERAAVEAIFARIAADRRHIAPAVISARETEQRNFGSWDFVFQEVSTVEDCAAFAENVAERVRHVQDRTLRILFTGFAYFDPCQEPYANAA